MKLVTKTENVSWRTCILTQEDFDQSLGQSVTTS